MISRQAVDASLIIATLEGVSFADANMTGADLRTTDLSNSFLDHADFTGAKFFGADLSDATLVGANLTGSDLRSIYYDVWTEWPKGFTPPPSRSSKHEI